MDDDNYTPESLAWKLLLDEDIPNSDILEFSEPGENKYVIKFEILLTIYLELIVNYYKMLYIENNIDENMSDDDVDNNFKLNFDNLTLDILLNPFKEKIQKIKHQLIINEISKEHFDHIKNLRYCTIMFRDSLKDEPYFIMNKDYIEKDKKYHFVLYGPTIENKNSFNHLKDLFACVNINNKYFKICFDKL
jgi:hypothetical protein